MKLYLDDLKAGFITFSKNYITKVKIHMLERRGKKKKDGCWLVDPKSVNCIYMYADIAMDCFKNYPYESRMDAY